MSITKHAAGRAPALEGRAGLAVSALLVGLLALVFRMGLLDAPAMFDELYHLLAARGWLETGRPTILAGEYTRTTGFTALVAQVFRLTENSSLVTGRLVAVVAGVLLPVALFVWLHLRLGWLAAAIAAALTILSPTAIDEAQTLRFYSWHVLFFLMGAIFAFEAAEGPARRLVWAGLSALCLALALYLQVTTAIGIAGIALWVALFAALPPILRRRDRWRIGGLLAAGALALLAASLATGIFQEAWELYRWVPQWAERNQTNDTYYHVLMQTYYPTFWPLFPLIVLIAYRHEPRLASFCTLLFVTILVLQSFGGMKADRYLSYAMPFFFALVGLAVAAILPPAGRFVMEAADQVNATGRRWLSAGLVMAALAFALVSNPFFERSLDALRGTAHGKVRLTNADWSGYPALVAGWPEPDVLVTSRELQTILHAGDYDVLVEQSRLDEIGDGSEFSVDPRTGRPVVREIESVAALIRCHPTGMFVAEEFWWFRDGWGARIAPLFAEAGRSFEVRNRAGLVAVRWSGDAADRGTCDRIAAEMAS